MTKRLKSVVVGSFVFALGAGTLMGVGVGRYSVAPSAPKSQLATELGLTGDQQAKMEAIWSGAMQTSGPGYMERRRALQEERDAAIAELLQPALLAEYDKILDRYRGKLDTLNQERSKSFEDAQSRTEEILTPEQRTKYVEIMKRRDGGRRGGPPDGGHRGRGGPGGIGPGGPGPHDDLQVDHPRGQHD
jgi:Spy/CpxP family protein refolding chaperone